MSASPFDELANDYDRAFTRSAVGGVLRAMIWERLPRVFPSGGQILELGCGTGEDAVWLARAGYRVVATDASPEMIRIARLKAISAGVAASIEFHCMPMEAIHTLPAGRTFDGVFSNFGAVNCVADIPRLSRSLARRLVPGAPLMFVVMGRYVPWEWGWYLARGDRRRAFRRLNPAGTPWRGMQIHYPTPAQLERDLAPAFITQRRAALGFALPPSYASGWLDGAHRTLALLTQIERATRRFTAALADHYVLEAARPCAR